MSGALAERVFVEKLETVGFADLAIHERRAFGIEDVATIPLFTPDLIELMHELIPPAQQDEVATSVTLTAVKPADR